MGLGFGFGVVDLWVRVFGCGLWVVGLWLWVLTMWFWGCGFGVVVWSCGFALWIWGCGFGGVGSGL